MTSAGDYEELQQRQDISIYGLYKKEILLLISGENVRYIQCKYDATHIHR